MGRELRAALGAGARPPLACPGLSSVGLAAILRGRRGSRLNYFALTNYSPDLHRDLALGAAFLKIRQCFLRLIERKHFVYHWADFSGFKKFANFRELATVGMHEQE
jgi:hypothetical protein